jgi:hypothetical protein
LLAGKAQAGNLVLRQDARPTRPSWFPRPAGQQNAIPDQHHPADRPTGRWLHVCPAAFPLLPHDRFLRRMANHRDIMNKGTQALNSCQRWQPGKEKPSFLIELFA